jgi:hypothetical protein
MTDPEIFKLLGQNHIESVNRWLEDTSAIGVLVVTNLQDKVAITEVASIKTEEDLKSVAKALIMNPNPVKRTLVFRSWLIPKKLTMEGACPSQHTLVMLSDGDEFRGGFRMDICRESAGGWTWKEVPQEEEVDHMELAPEMIWAAYTNKLLGIAVKGLSGQPTCREYLEIVENKKVDIIPMPKVAVVDIIV